MGLRETNTPEAVKKGGRPRSTPQQRMEKLQEKFLADLTDEERAEWLAAEAVKDQYGPGEQPSRPPTVDPIGPANPSPVLVETTKGKPVVAMDRQPESALSMPRETAELPEFFGEDRAAVLVAPGSTYSMSVNGWVLERAAGDALVNVRTTNMLKLTGTVTPAKLVPGHKHPNADYQNVIEDKVSNPGQSNRIVVKRTERGLLLGCAVRVDDELATRNFQMTLEELVFRIMRYGAYGTGCCFIEDDETFDRIQNKFGEAYKQAMQDMDDKDIALAQSGMSVN